MRYVEARITEKTHALIYRIYVTDTLQSIANNTGVIASGFGESIRVERRYYDFVKPQKEETRTADEIIDGIRSKLNSLRK